MEPLLQDVRYAFRQLRKNPAFATVAVLTLALGIGANTTIFSVMNATFLQIEPDRPVSQARSMEEIVHDSIGSRRFPAVLLSAFALLALVLVAVGIIGVVSYSVAQRTQEIGIRIALGACSGDVQSLIVSASMKWVLMGVAVGMGASMGLARLLGNLLYEVKPSNPLLLGAVALLLTAVAALASYIPARRACKVDPMVALHYD
jgi:ABC-type antimicrobial peptide transport system, permease component